ncbi:MAG TPA: cytochrome P450 [Solirubrobacteraceae bacterium]|nr:cytochrome P450 [Solirubrobacteraceae bacterium]
MLRGTRSASDSLPPGPRLPRAVQMGLFNWRFAEFTERAHARFGDTFTCRVGGLPESVLTKDRDAIRRLLTGDPLLKRSANDQIRPIVGEHSMLVIEPQEHLARRKLLLSPFHGDHVRSHARLIERLVSVELDRIQAGEVVRMQSVAQALTLEVILQAVLGLSDARTRARLHEIFDAMNTPLGSLVLFMPQLVRRSRWNLPAAPFWRLQDEFDALLADHIAATRADPRLAEREDILAMMVLARDEDGVGLDDGQLRDEMVTLIGAGHDTTATSIAWGVELLAHNPAVAEKAREAEDAYMEALVKEVLRIRTLLPIASARQVLEPFPIGRWTIPPGVTIWTNGHAVHNDPAIYPQPHVFRPERFLEDPPDGYAFMPFGGGAHRCLGSALALLEMKVVLRAILRRLEFGPTSDRIARPVRRHVTLAPKGGARVQILAKHAASGASGEPVPALPV